MQRELTRESQLPFFPYKWDQPPAHLFLVFAVVCKSCFQHSLLIADSPNHQEGINQEHRQGHPAAQYQRHRTKHQYAGGIHWMAHHAVQTGINHPLPLLHLHRAGQVGVFTHHLRIQAVGKQKDKGGNHRHPAGHPAPCKAKIQAVQNESGQEHQNRCADHLSLLGLCLPPVQTLFQQRRCLQPERHAENQHRYEQQRAKQPSGRIAQRSCRQKNQQTDRKRAHQVADQRLCQKPFLHIIISASRSIMFCQVRINVSPLFSL